MMLMAFNNPRGVELNEMVWNALNMSRTVAPAAELWSRHAESVASGQRIPFCLVFRKLQIEQLNGNRNN